MIAEYQNWEGKRVKKTVKLRKDLEQQLLSCKFHCNISDN